MVGHAPRRHEDEAVHLDRRLRGLLLRSLRRCSDDAEAEHAARRMADQDVQGRHR